MKKYFMIFAAAVLAAVACSKEEPQANEPATITYNFSIADKPSLDPSTKAVKTGWESGDKIYIVFDDPAPTALTDFLILQYDGSKWDVAQQPSSSNQPNSEGGTLDALYYANPNPTFHQTDGFDYRTSYGKYMWLKGNNLSYSLNNNVLESTISLAFNEDSMFYKWLQICVTGLTGDWTISICNSDDSFKTCNIWHPRFTGNQFNYRSNGTSVQDVQLNKQSDGHYLYCLPYFDKENDLTTFKFVLKNDTYGTFTKTFTRSPELEKKHQAITFKGPQFDENGDVTNGWTKQ